MGIGDPEVEEIFRNNKIDILCHHAAQMDVRKSVADPVFDAGVNIIDAVKLLEYCNKYKVGKVIFSSTGGAIYGEPEKIPADENTPALPLCPYESVNFASRNTCNITRPFMETNSPSFGMPMYMAPDRIPMVRRE